jgi:hypothetical protein
MSSDEELTAELAAEIADYLMLNPQAADGVEGIMRWWLREPRRGVTHERVRAALALLEARGLVRRRVLQDGHEIFSRAPDGPRPTGK